MEVFPQKTFPNTMAGNNAPSFKAADLRVELTSTPKTKGFSAKAVDIPFGAIFTDHMLTVEWDVAEGWQAPHIKPFGNLSMHPACSSLHYAIQLFEGLKVSRGDDGRLRFFRPMLNMKRMSKSAKRACLPAFDESELLECIRRLVEVEQDWVPDSSVSDLYVRPAFVGTEPTLGLKKPNRALLYVIMCLAGSYFKQTEPISLWADPKYVRAWTGGTGDCKMGGNYGCSLSAQYEAVDYGCQQVLWLYGEDHQISEAGTMNIFLHWVNENGEEELATPPLEGIILPGVTRQSVLDLTRKWGDFVVAERNVTMTQLCSALEEQRVRGMFGSGTACAICPVGKIVYQGKILHIPAPNESSCLASRITQELNDIKFGRTPSDWTLLV